MNTHIFTLAWVVMACALVAHSAAAQTPRKNTLISVSYQFFVEGDTQSVSNQAALARQGRRQLYALMAKECEVLLDTIAAECRMSRANVNTQLRRRRGGRAEEGIRLTGSASYRIVLKPNAAGSD